MPKPVGFPRGFVVVFLTVLFVALPETAHGWGESGHRIINQAAAKLMKSSLSGFFKANSDNLALLSTTPDLKWKQSSTKQKEKSLFYLFSLPFPKNKPNKSLAGARAQASRGAQHVRALPACYPMSQRAS